MGDPVLAKNFAVLGDGIAAEVDVLSNLGALLVEEGDLVLAALRPERGEVEPEPLAGLGGGRSAAASLGRTWSGGVGPLAHVVGAGLGPLVEAAASDGERLKRREAGPALGPRRQRRRRRDQAGRATTPYRPLLRRLTHPGRRPRRGAPELLPRGGAAVVGVGHGATNHSSRPHSDPRNHEPGLKSADGEAILGEPERADREIDARRAAPVSGKLRTAYHTRK